MALLWLAQPGGKSSPRGRMPSHLGFTVPLYHSDGDPKMMRDLLMLEWRQQLEENK